MSALLSIVSMIGFLVLTGVVVNNGIVFIDYVNQMRAEGMDMYEFCYENGIADYLSEGDCLV